MTFGGLLAAVAAVCAFLLLHELAKGWRGRHPSIPRLALPKLVSRVGELVAQSQLARRLTSREDLKATVVAAGEPFGFSMRDWLATKGVCAMVAGLFSLAIAPSLPGRLGVVAFLASPVAGFFLPDFWLSRTVRHRGERATAEIPDMLDLLKVAIEGGQAPVSALASVARRFDGVLAVEWRRVAMSVRLGEPFDRALAGLSKRIDSPSVLAFAELLRGANRHGLSVGEGLGRLAAATRHARAQRVRERAARAGPKIQLVVSLVLVPSTLLVIAAGVLAQLGDSGLFA